MAPPKPIHTLVLDANPLIKNEPSISTLLAQSKNLYTIPAVIDEIRDADARSRIQTTVLPFLKLRTPRPASIKLIGDFARRTGDLEVLSRPDLQILALAYELECERNGGDWRLRSLPGQARTNGPMPEGLAEKHRKEEEEEEKGSNDVSDVKNTTTHATVDQISEDKNDTSAESNNIVEPGLVSDTETIDGNKVSHNPEETNESITDTQTSEPTTDTQLADSLSKTTIQDDSMPSEDDSDDEGWITPSNLQSHITADSNPTSSTPLPTPATMQVATLTSDYAMQNILLRMNLNLLAPTLQRIRTLKTYILRCHACFATTPDMTRQFCRKCGGATLLRTSCSTDANGVFKLHLKKNMQWNNRGNVFSIPKPTAGSSNGKRSVGGGQGHWGMNLILAEDQPEYQKLVTEEKRRKGKDLMDEDFLPDLLSGGRRGPQGRIKVGGGRNINSRKRH